MLQSPLIQPICASFRKMVYTVTSGYTKKKARYPYEKSRSTSDWDDFSLKLAFLLPRADSHRGCPT